MLLTNTQVSKIRKAFGNSLAGNIKFAKTHLTKMKQLRKSIIEALGIHDQLINMINIINSLTVLESKTSVTGLGLKLANNDIKDIEKLIKFLDN